MSTLTKNVTYPIVETFHSLQGEGYWTGVNAFFIRLGGCDVHCPWCDTKHSWNPQRHPQQPVTELVKAVNKAKPAIVIITGGEPLMHDLQPLTTALRDCTLDSRFNGLQTRNALPRKIQVHLETSGAHPMSGKFDWVTFSPKQFKAPHPSIYECASELKVVIASEYDLKWAEQQAALLPTTPTTLRYLQPEWSSPRSQELVFDYIINHPQWRMSIQTHKHLKIQ